MVKPFYYSNFLLSPADRYRDTDRPTASRLQAGSVADHDMTMKVQTLHTSAQNPTLRLLTCVSNKK